MLPRSQVGSMFIKYQLMNDLLFEFGIKMYN